ncbi:hypothetical protein H1R20_g11631, partial [Candolleomyces eurysporus]
MKLMKRKKVAIGVPPITTVPSSRVTRFLAQPDLGPTAQNFQLFLDFASLESPQARKAANAWNRRAGEVFVQSFIQFEKQVLHEEEDEDAVTAMRKAAKEQLRRSRCERRIDVLKACDKDPAMKRLYKFAAANLSWKCCSGESTDTQGESAITVLPWRARRIRSFMRTLDLLHLAIRFPINHSRSAGRLPKARYDPQTLDPPREPVKEVAYFQYVTGLPANFYDEEWLESLSQFERDHVNPGQPIDLTIPRHIVVEAEAAATLRGKKTRPLLRNFNM